MKYLPLFLDLNQRSVLVVGGGIVAARKIKILSKVGANIKVVANILCAELLEMVQSKSLYWINTTFQEFMLDEIFLVIVATDDAVLNTLVYLSAEKRHIFVNVVDDQSKCSFIFPAIIDRSPIMVAISSCGYAPVLARILREKLESLLPTFLGPMAILAGFWRKRVKKNILSKIGQRRFWERAFNGRFASFMAYGRFEQANKELRSSLYDIDHKEQKGDIALVGAGPGDCGLLTLRGLQLIQQADVVLHDYLVSSEVLNLVRRDANLICVGKRISEHLMSQDDINQLLIQLAQQGNKVVRLKGGDPFIFGRGGEELQQAAKAGIPFQVVPGITAAIGATAYAGIPLTHRQYTHSIIITGHINIDSNYFNWKLLANKYQTLVIYMGTINANQIGEKLIFYGYDPQTPIAIISKGTCKDQQVLIGILEQLGNLIKSASSPTLLVIGEVVSLHYKINWFGQDSIEKYNLDPLINLV